MKLLQTLLLVLMVGSFGLAYAEDEPKEYGSIEEIEAEPYESIDGKWEVEVEFEEGDITFYVYDIASTDDLPEAIASYMQDELDLDVSESDVSDIIEIDADEREEDEEDEEVSEELEIEAEPYESIDGKWEVEIEFDGEEYEFFLTDVDSADDLPVLIAEYAQENLDLDLAVSEVEMVLEVDEEDERDEDEEEDEDEEKEDKVDKEKKDKPEQLSQSDRDTLLRLLLLLLIQTIMERDGSVGSEIQKLFDEFR